MSYSTPRFILAVAALVALATSGCTDLTPCTRGTEGCACTQDNTCDAVADGTAICAQGTCVVQRSYDEATVCYNACAYRQDGFCDDGAAGSSDHFCLLGSDCSDCGQRPNPCVGQSNPQFCPQTSEETQQCWPANVDCLTVRYCNALLPAQRGPFACPTGQAIDCDALGGPKCVAAPSSCTAAGKVACIKENACVDPYIDCNSLTACGGQTIGCFTGESVACNNNVASCQPPNRP